MNLRHEAVVPAPVERVREAIQDPERWRSWLPGLTALTVDGDEVELELRAPHPVRVRVALTRHDFGIRWTLVQGDATTATGAVEVEPVDHESAVRWEVEVAFAPTLPGPLVRELEQELLPRWTDALTREVTC